MKQEDRPLEVVFMATEFSPLAKVGGLADVVAALSAELARLGQRVTVWMPAYRHVLDQPLPFRPMAFTRPLRIPMGSSVETIGLSEVELDGPGFRLILVHHAGSFDRPGIYNDPTTGEGYPDNDRRSVLFQRAVLEGLKAVDLKPDILHLNDYQTGLVPTYLRTAYASDAFYRGTGNLFTIHNLGYQGIFPAEILRAAGLSMDLFYPTGPLEFWGRVNFMKAAIVFADRLTTVSPRYAREIQTTEEFGFGLEGVLRARANDLRGILNGIDYRVWDPATDPLVPHPYTMGNLSGKRKSKAALLARVGLPAEAMKKPLIGIISRLVDQKGLDLLSDAMPGILAEGFRMVVLGTGQRKYEEMMSSWQTRHPDQVSYSHGFDDPLAHLIEAGSDFFLMPSRYEPCGLNQLISLRYGTVPIVRETGGFIDTVEPFLPETGVGTGFRFRDYTVESLLSVIRMARRVHEQPAQMEAMRRRGMSQDFSWERSARQYLDLYRDIVAGNHRR